MSVNVALEITAIILPESKRVDITGMDILAYLLLQILNGYNWTPKIVVLDIKTRLICRNMREKHCTSEKPLN